MAVLGIGEHGHLAVNAAEVGFDTAAYDRMMSGDGRFRMVVVP